MQVVLGQILTETELDKCPQVRGTVANQGCPEVSEEVMKTLNYGKVILFDSGKSTFQQGTYTVYNLSLQS
jgi:hypothetical protein